MNILTMNPINKPFNISEWSISINLKEYINIFNENGYDDFVSIIESNDNQSMHRIKLLKYIQKYVKQNKLKS